MSGNHKIYENFDKLYELIWHPFFKDSFKKVCARINSLNGKNLLEIGIGPGETLSLYDDSKSVIGTDISEAMIQNAQKKIESLGLKNCNVVHTPLGEKLPFEDHSFDIIVSFSVVSVVKEPERFLEKLTQLIRPGGHLVLVAHFQTEEDGTPARVWDNICEPFTQALMGFTMKTSEEVLKNLEGFKVVEKFSASKLGPLTFNTCYLLQKG